MAKPEREADSEAPDGETDGDAPVDGEKKGFVKKILGNKKLMIIAAAALVVLLAGIAAALYFFVFAKNGTAEQSASTEMQFPATPPQVAYFKLDEIIVNIQGTDGNPVYLKLVVSLELYSAEETAGIQALKARIVDQYLGYLRELRPDDLKGSAGVMRIKEELLRRTNVAAAPYKVRDVLLNEMILQ
jgi:flagellar protein FliL